MCINPVKSGGGVKLLIDGKEYSELNLRIKSQDFKSDVLLPYKFSYGSAVVYNDELYILGGTDTNTDTYHYKYIDEVTQWKSVSTLPYSFKQSCAVVYNNNIHILGGSSYVPGQTSTFQTLLTNHYSWNGSEWTSVSTLPFYFVLGSAVIYNNEIHILGGGLSTSDLVNSIKHYKWNGSSWTSVSTLPFNFQCGAAVVYRNELHIFGSQIVNNDKYHYKWNGSSWTSVCTTTINLRSTNNAVVYKDRIYINAQYIMFDGNEWKYYRKAPFSIQTNDTEFVFNNRICVTDTISEGSTSGKYHLWFLDNPILMLE